MRILCFFFLLILVGCGYHFEEESSIPRHTTISVPYVEGDWDGGLTAAIVEQIGRTGCYTYQRDGGALTLKVQLGNFIEDNIGFRYDRDKHGDLRHSIIPTETRLKAKVVVTLIETASGRALLGPACLTAWIEFDHDYESPLNSVNIFSLGQLSDYDDAFDAAYRPLNRELAQKVVDFICDSW
ncbi:MAG: hypothetical protein LLG04_06240 [Parachlamydia sp.]|nr:hypothetical protein [Parachlamydia sp.]